MFVVPVLTIADLFPETGALVSKSEVPPLQCSPVHLHLPLPPLPRHTPTQVVLKGLQEAIDAPQHLSWFILLALYHHLQQRCHIEYCTTTMLVNGLDPELINLTIICLRCCMLFNPYIQSSPRMTPHPH